jgi:hypothetical protein
MGNPYPISGKLASFNHAWHSNKGTFRASGMARIEPTLPKNRFRLSQYRLGAALIPHPNYYLHHHFNPQQVSDSIHGYNQIELPK